MNKYTVEVLVNNRVLLMNGDHIEDQWDTLEEAQDEIRELKDSVYDELLEVDQRQRELQTQFDALEEVQRIIGT